MPPSYLWLVGVRCTELHTSSRFNIEALTLNIEVAHLPDLTTSRAIIGGRITFRNSP
jgi:hypothetical protein